MILTSLFNVQEMDVRYKVKGKMQMKIMFPWTHSIDRHFSCQLILMAVFSLDQYVIYFGSTKSHTTGMRLVFLPTENHLLFSRQQLFCLSLSTSCFFQFSHLFSIVCILFSVNRRQSAPEELFPWIHFFSLRNFKLFFIPFQSFDLLNVKINVYL